MTPHQRRYMGALWLVVVLAIGAALSSGWVALAFGAGSVVVLAAAGRRRMTFSQLVRLLVREGIAK